MQNDDGEWINVTTLPMLEAAKPLYDVGGYRLALLWPMLGAVLAAFAVRDVARQLGDDDAGWLAFWVTGLASPIAIYALDFWEHSLGAGLMVAAFALLLRVVRGSRAWWLPFARRRGARAAATMRTESFVAALTFVGGTCLFLLVRRRVAWAFARGSPHRRRLRRALVPQLAARGRAGREQPRRLGSAARPSGSGGPSCRSGARRR